MQHLSAVFFSKPVSVPDWRGQKSRTYLTDVDAEIRLDLDARIVVLTPKGQGTRNTAPLENVTNWAEREAANPALKSVR